MDVRGWIILAECLNMIIAINNHPLYQRTSTHLLTVTSFYQLLFLAQFMKKSELLGVGSADGPWTSALTTGNIPGGFPAARARRSIKNQR